MALRGPDMAGCPGAALSGAVLESAETAFWIYDFDAERIVWANAAALRLWDAPTPEALYARDLGLKMTPSVSRRLRQHREEFAIDPEREIRELWTLYPQGRPQRVSARLRRLDRPGRDFDMLVEARPDEIAEATTIRSADALLHTTVVTALFDREGRELYANPAFRDAFGPGPRRFAGDLFPAEDGATILDCVDRCGFCREVVRTAAGRELRWFEVQAVRCRDAVSGDGAFLISALDVTRTREQAEALAAALARAQAADRAKSRFLSTVSHELRTPLNGVIGLASLLSAQPLAPAAQRSVAEIARCGLGMLGLVENLLEMVAFDMGETPFAPAPFDPAEILRAAVDDARMRADDDVALAADTERLPRLRYVNDRRRVRQVLDHLLDNAVKFGGRGRVRASVSASADASTEARLRFEVSDEGPGVPAEERDRIFDRFHQLDASETRRHGGTGVGLALCREIVGLWGGRLGVTDRPGGGALFWFDAPTDASAPSSPNTRADA